MVRITTIIPAYNAEHSLQRAVDSLIGTQYPDLEIVIVDDGSSDKTWEVANRLSEENSKSVVCFQHPQAKNQGVSASRNLGIERSTGEWISFLDADDYVLPHRFQRAAQILTEKPDVDGVHGLARVEFSSPEAQANWWDGVNQFGILAHVSPEELIFELLQTRTWPTSAILFRRQVIESTGVFDTQKGIAEDCHFWFRMAMCSRLVNEPEPEEVSVYWRHGESAFQVSTDNRVYMIEAMTSFYQWAEKHCPNDPRMDRVRQMISDYILKGLTYTRTTRQFELARKIGWLSWKSFPAIRRRREFWSHSLRSLLNR